ncbi:MAG: zinc-ribbon domain-containing protein [Xanthobacteraceae bacterium]
MLIVCPSCATAYSVEPATLRPDGRNVRCARCRTVWRAELSQADRLLAAAAALAPQTGAEELPAAVPAAANAVPSFAEAGSSSGAVGDDGLPETTDEAGGAEFSANSNPVPEMPDGAGSMEVEAPPIVPADLDAGRTPIDVDGDRAVAPVSEHPENMEVVAARRRRDTANGSRHFWTLAPLQIAILVLIILDAIIVGWRKDIVRLLPQTASLYAAIGMPVNLRGLTFDDVTTSTQTYQKVPILVVKGEIVNDTGVEIEVPQLKLVLRNAAKQDIYSWTAAPPQTRLSAYQAVGFLARLASPPSDSRDLLVRFLEPRDLAAPAR